jgi:hypothetical protein
MRSRLANAVCDAPLAARRTFAFLSMGCALSAATPASGAEVEGPAADAQPGLHRVGVAQAARPTLAVTAGYGYTEAQADAEGGHHRLSLKLAGSVPVVSWLNVAPALDTRHDIHQNDSGTVIDASLAVRASLPSDDFHLGLELKPWVPGSEGASAALDALSLDARALFAKSFDALLLACHVGYRLDRSAAAGSSAAQLAPGDRLALGASEFDALLVGVGSGLHLERTELYVEVSGDVLMGAGAPPFGQSPLRAAGGARRALTERLSAEAVLEASLSARPALGRDAPLVPIEPRVSVFAGIRYDFGSRRQPSAGTAAAAAPVAPAPKLLAAAAASPAAPEAALELALVDDEGAPVTDATIRLAGKGPAQTVRADASGKCRAEHLSPGTVTLVLEAGGFEPLERTLTLEPGAPLALTITLKALPPPSQVRGVVRSFGGKGLAARIRVEPLGLEAKTDASGGFQLDVPPGNYEVVVESDGYQLQRRKISVDPQGVVILNADLVKQR